MTYNAIVSLVVLDNSDDNGNSFERPKNDDYDNNDIDDSDNDDGSDSDSDNDDGGSSDDDDDDNNDGSSDDNNDNDNDNNDNDNDNVNDNDNDNNIGSNNDGSDDDVNDDDAKPLTNDLNNKASSSALSSFFLLKSYMLYMNVIFSLYNMVLHKHNDDSNSKASIRPLLSLSYILNNDSNVDDDDAPITLFLI